MKKQVEKVDYRELDWINTFDDEVRFIRAEAKTAAGSLYSEFSDDEATGVVLFDLLDHLDKVNELIQGVFSSIRSERHPKLSPEVEKKRKALTPERDKQYVMAGSKVMDKFDRKLKALERR